MGHLVNIKYLPSSLESLGLIPLKSAGDGSCLFRAVSLLLFGNQNFHVELRGCTIIELAGMIFSSNLDRRKINPLVYVKFWRQACLPSLLYGAEVFRLTPTILTKFERCQSWVLKSIFYVPKFAPNLLLQRLPGLNSIESEIVDSKLLFLGLLFTEPKMAQSVRSLFMSRAESYFDASLTSMSVLPSIIEALNKYNLFHFFVSWFHNTTFPTYSNWKRIVKTKVRNLEDNAWADYCVNHPDLHIAQACLKM